MWCIDNNLLCKCVLTTMKIVPMVSPSKPAKTVHIAIGFFFFVNYIVGVGFLGIPKTFDKAGFFPSLFTLVAISFFAWTTATWLIEVVSRAQVSERGFRGGPRGRVGRGWGLPLTRERMEYCSFTLSCLFTVTYNKKRGG